MELHATTQQKPELYSEYVTPTIMYSSEHGERQVVCVLMSVRVPRSSKEYWIIHVVLNRICKEL